MNFWFVGVPYNIFIGFANMWNLYFNLEFNYFWAGANLYLLMNTMFGFIQSILSVLIVFEVPVWLIHAK